jgi:ABC-type oligopeptide transport system ATPase subunit
VLAWLVSALMQVDVAHTILALVAEHGSIKSTTTKHLVSLIDPSNPVVRRAPQRRGMDHRGQRELGGRAGQPVRHSPPVVLGLPMPLCRQCAVTLSSS